MRAGNVFLLIGYALSALALTILIATWQLRSKQLAASRNALATCSGNFAELSTHANEQQRIIDALRMQVELQSAP